MKKTAIFEDVVSIMTHDSSTIKDRKGCDPEPFRENITDDMTVISENGMLALNQSKNKMKVVDLSTQKTEVITCKDDQVLRPIGFIEKDFIYGVGNKKEVARINRKMKLKNKKSRNIIGIIQSFLILILVVLIIFMMIQISRLQGTARVINYAGLVRGATQREIKLEITGNQNDELIKYLDDILLGLRYQDGHYDLVKLNDEEYQEKLQIQSDYWDKLKTEIEAVRNKGYENTDIVNMSEIYFTMADETVSAAESYSEKIAVKIRTIELLSALDMLSLVILVIMQTLKAMQMAMQNRLLEQKAFVDAHTGLPNKNACNELLNKKDIITDSTACIMFDLNNLKTVNDTMGHSAGDQLILNFAKLLRSVIPEKDFVGRYGGDEFIAVIYHTSEAEIKEILKSLSREKERLNSCENQLPIDYACGWALSSDDMACTMQMLLDDADAYMYKNKQLCKKYN